jgi:hypothetical protein
MKTLSSMPTLEGLWRRWFRMKVTGSLLKKMLLKRMSLVLLKRRASPRRKRRKALMKNLLIVKLNALTRWLTNTRKTYKRAMSTLWSLTRNTLENNTKRNF